MNTLVTRALVFLVLAGVSAARADAARPLIVGDTGRSSASWPLLMARDHGFFSAEHLAVDLVCVRGITQVTH